MEEDKDMISRLVDDLLLSILETVCITTAMRVLSRRWRHVPWLLPQLTIDASDFLREPYADPTVEDHIDRAMCLLTEAIKTMLVPARRTRIVTRLLLSLFLTNSHSSEVGALVNEAVESGMIKDIELVSGAVKFPWDISVEEMESHAHSVNGFFRNYPKIWCCLTSLVLYNATFVESDLHNLLANVCTQLDYLCLTNCDTGVGSFFEIDAPDSKLTVLQFASCNFGRVELVCLPKLEEVSCGYWWSEHLPLTLGYVPCLEEIDIYSNALCYNGPFKLSELLGGTTSISSAKLDFGGRKIWLQPENKDQLRSALSSLKKLCVNGIFVGFGLTWTTALLEAATSLEKFDVAVSEHICCDREENIEVYGERTNAPWEVSKTVHLSLKELQLCGFNRSEEHIAFIGAIMERAPNLQVVVLKELYCEACSAVGTIPSERGFPKEEEKQKAVLNDLRNRFSCRAQVIFYEHKSSSD